MAWASAILWKVVVVVVVVVVAWWHRGVNSRGMVPLGCWVLVAVAREVCWQTACRTTTSLGALS